MKPVFPALLLLLLVLGIPMHSSEQNHIKTMRLAVVNAPPVIMFDALNELPRGLAINVIKEISSRIDLPVEFIKCNEIVDAEQMVVDKQVDGVLGLERTVNREKYLKFTKPLIHMENLIYARKEMNYPSMESLDGLTVCVLQGSTIEDHIVNFHPTIKLIKISSEIGCIAVIESGKAAAAILRTRSSRLLMEQGITTITAVGSSGMNYEPTIAIRTDLPILFNTIDHNMNHMTENHQLSRIQFNWLGPPDDKSTHYIYYAVIAIGLGGIGILVFLLMRTSLLRKKLQAQNIEIEKLANSDSLTGLPNRRNLLLYMDELIESGKFFSMLFMDLDRFKTINDTFGHVVGDRLLVDVAARLRSSVRDTERFFRIGGDEFIIIVDSIDRNDVTTIVERLLVNMSESFIIDDLPFRVTPSVGVCSFPTDGADAIVILQNADMAMYASKDAGRNTFSFFDKTMINKKKAGIENDLRFAEEKSELVVHYQPQIDLRTGKISGAEALIRWNHPTLKLIPPMEFIPIAEETDLIIHIGRWIMTQACSTSKQWTDSYESIRIGINVSARQMMRGDIYETVSNALKITGASPRMIEIEITESALLQNADRVRYALSKIHDLGVSLSIDDFGTGYSNLDLIRQFPINRIKIDKSFIRDVTTNKSNQSLVKAIIDMARTLGVSTIAEGIETKEQLEYVRMAGCDEAQGFFFSRPVPLDQFKGFYELYMKK